MLTLILHLVIAFTSRVRDAQHGLLKHVLMLYSTEIGKDRSHSIGTEVVLHSAILGADNMHMPAPRAIHMAPHSLFGKRKHASNHSIKTEKTWWTRASEASPITPAFAPELTSDGPLDAIPMASTDTLKAVTEASLDNEWLAALYGCQSSAGRVRLLALRIVGNPKEQAMTLTSWCLQLDGRQQYMGRSLLHCMVEDVKNKFDQRVPFANPFEQQQKRETSRARSRVRAPSLSRTPSAAPSAAPTEFEEQWETKARTPLGLRGVLLKPSATSWPKIEAFQATFPGDPDYQTEMLLSTGNGQGVSDSNIRQLLSIIEFLLREFTQGTEPPRLRSSRGRKVYKMGSSQWVAA